MDINQVLLKQNIARIRRDIDKASNCSGAARVLMHLENDLRLYLEKLDADRSLAG